MSTLYPIPQFEGYLINKQGQVFATHTTKFVSNNNSQRTLLDTPKQLRAHVSRYATVVLSRNGKKHTCGVHRLLLSTFVSEQPSTIYALHNNGDRLDNRLENLRWGTPQDNANDKIKHGNSLKGGNNPKAKLNSLKVRVIRHAYNLGLSQQKLANMFGVCQTQISRVILSKAWKEA